MKNEISFPNLYERDVSVPGDPIHRVCRLKIITYDEFKEWFDEHVEPVNKLLSEGVEVYYDIDEQDGYFWHERKYLESEKKALLINITEIKKETAEDVLNDLVSAFKGFPDLKNYDGELYKLHERAKAVLGESEL